MRGWWPVWTLWLVGTVWLVACGLPGAAGDGERALADLQESAVAAFILGRAEGSLPNGRLEYSAGGIYSVGPSEGEAAGRIWQVRQPRADALVLPLDARDRAASVTLKADVLVRYEERYCDFAAGPGAPSRCLPWQDATCCNRIWKRQRGEWIISRPD
jgi:hypothetical protein